MIADRVSPEQLYHLRSLLLAVDQAQVDLNQARIAAARCQLDIEKECSLLGEDAKLDIATGKITRGKDEQEVKAEKGQQEKEEPAA